MNALLTAPPAAAPAGPDPARFCVGRDAAAPAQTAAVPPAARLALDLHAAMLEAPRLRAAALAAVCLLARALAAQRVSLGWAQADGHLQLLAVSDGRVPTPHSAADEPLLAALAECLDQQAVVRWPEADADAAMPRITLAQRALLASAGAAAAVSLPLVSEGRVLGALTLEWADTPGSQQPLGGIENLEHLAAWMAPVLALMQANERPWLRRWRDNVADWLDSRDQPERRRWRSLLPAGLALALLLGAWPATRHIGGPARLEGAVQRVLSAPTDGFIAQVHVRPGDSVRAGQPLLDLADRDLQLERQRWQSQLAQQLEGLAAAQARTDRAALSQHQAKADEAQAQLDLVDEKLQRSRLVAPFDAVVVQGDLAQQLGAPVKLGAELMTLAPLGAYRVIVEVDERDVAELRLGQPGLLALSALPWAAMPLLISRISPVAKAPDGRNVFEVEASLPTPPAELRPGLLGQARIDAGRAPLAWQAVRRLVAGVRLWWWRLVA